MNIDYRLIGNILLINFIVSFSARRKREGVTKEEEKKHTHKPQSKLIGQWACRGKESENVCLMNERKST